MIVFGSVGFQGDQLRGKVAGTQRKRAQSASDNRAFHASPRLAARLAGAC